MMDRTKPNVERSQIGFIQFIVSPIYEAYAHINTDIQQTCLVEVEKNRQYFADLVAKLPPLATAGSAAPAAASSASTAAVKE
jgi:hypothetical protein